MNNVSSFLVAKHGEWTIPYSLPLEYSLFSSQPWHYAFSSGSNNYNSSSHLPSVCLMSGVVLAALIFTFLFNLYSNSVK